MSKSISDHFCDRAVKRSLYERNNPEVHKWWKMLFDNLEREYNLPNYLKFENVYDIIPDNIFKRVCRILNIIPDERLLTSKVKRATWTAVAHEKPSAKLVLPPRKVEKKRSVTEVPSKMFYQPELTNAQKYGLENPYAKFLHKPGDSAKIWRPLAVPPIDQMQLLDKADAISYAIAFEFCQWLGTLGESDAFTLNVNSITKMFEVGFNTHAATSLCVRVKEMPSVPQSVADSIRQPQLSYRAKLRCNVLRDVKASEKPERLVAFGKTLPEEMRYKRPLTDVQEKWMKCKRVPAELASMSFVFEGITHLKSTRGFCGWLRNNKNIEPPAYLQKLGMLDSEYDLQAEASVESMESLGGDLPSTVVIAL